MQVWNFIANLLGGCISIKETKLLVGNTYGEKTLRIRAIYKILKQIKAGKNNNDLRKVYVKKSIQNAVLIAAVPTEYFHQKACTSIGTIVSILHKDLGLKKKMGAQGFVKGVDRRKWRPQQHS